MISVSTLARTIDWSGGLTLIQQNNPEWTAANQTFESIRALEGSARAGFLPEVSVSVGTNQSYSQNYNESSSATQRSDSANLNLSQNLFAGFADMARYNEAKQNTQIAHITWQQTKAKIGYDYKSAYAGLIYAQEYVALTKKIVDRRKENLNIVELRFNTQIRG